MRVVRLPPTAMLAVAAFFVAAAVPNAAQTQSPERALARHILDATGVKGGLIVQLGCQGGELTAALRASDIYLVHGLDTDAENVRQARRH